MKYNEEDSKHRHENEVHQKSQALNLDSLPTSTLALPSTQIPASDYPS